MKEDTMPLWVGVAIGVVVGAVAVIGAGAVIVAKYFLHEPLIK